MKRIILILLLPLFIASIAGDDNWTELYVRGNSYCSSELDAVDPFEEGHGPYGAHNLDDNNMATAWVEGVKGYGTGEYFFIGLGSDLPGSVMIANGYQKSETLFLKNSRVKSAHITLFAGFFIDGEVTEIASLFRVRQIGEESVVTLKDEMGMQEIILPETPDCALEVSLNLSEQFLSQFDERINQVKEYNPGCLYPVIFQYFLKFEIIDAYPGSSWDDTCISELFAGEVDPVPVNERETITRVYDGEDGAIFFDTGIRTGLTLVDMIQLKEFRESGDDVEMWIVLMDVSKDNEWAQVDFMFSAVGRRVDEYSVLYHVRSGSRIGTDILHTMYGMYGFKEEEGKIWLDTADGLVDLEKIRIALEVKY